MFLYKVNYRSLINQTCALCCLYPALVSGLCEDCHADLPWSLFCCPKCSQSKDSPLHSCPSCERNPNTFNHAIAPLQYRFPLTSIIPAIKNQRTLHHLGWLANLLALQVQASEQPFPQTILAVPMHPFDQLKRGFNQASLLANQLGKILNIRVEQTALRKRKRTAHQHHLNATERRANLRGAFQVITPLPDHVALVDDVMTTGSTLSEITDLLKRQGVKRVDVWVLARTPEPNFDKQNDA